MRRTGTNHGRRRSLRRTIVGALAPTTMLAAGAVRAQTAATVIELTQVGCPFLESAKGVDHGYAPRSADDCKAINEKTASACRLLDLPAIGSLILINDQ